MTYARAAPHGAASGAAPGLLIGWFFVSARRSRGLPFAPERHEVVTTANEPDAEPGTVVRVLRPGYGKADHQLRPGTAAVARRPE